MTNLFNNKYQLIEKIGQGGNGVVFKVKNIQTGEFYALKKVHKYILTSKKDREINRLKRFLDEIKIVKEVQNEIEGVLPILDLNLPSMSEIEKGEVPFYVMPIAIPLKEQIKGLNIEDKISCMMELSLTLNELHCKEIAHRDIKPENIYYYLGRWYLSDFGLVKYPDREELTRTNEAVGPWTTIAPEMKRNAKNADPLPADIYSLAKTLWMILTDNYKGFDGQYNYKNTFVSLEKSYSSDVHLTTLHDLLNIATSDEPSNRPNALKFHEILKKWFDIKDDFEKRSKVEWEFVLRGIAPNNPVSMSWRSRNSISEILNNISKLNALNHTFLPSGGGFDLIECKISEQEGFIELNLDGLLRIIKPKRLYLEIFDDPQWNYLFLETEQIKPSGVYEYRDEEKVYIEDLLEIEPGKYIETYHKNYGFYNGKQLPSNAREIILGLKGNYVIFPKYSFYNQKMDSYDAYQTKYNTNDQFRDFIERVIKTKEWHENNPEESKKLADQRKKEEEQEREQHFEKYNKEKALLEKFIEDYDLSFSEQFTVFKDNPFKYFVNFSITPGLKFYFSKEKKFERQKDTISLEYFLSPEKEYENHEEFFDWNDVKSFCKKIKDDFNNFTNNFECIGGISTFIKLKRVKKPLQLFSQNDIKQLINQGNDKKTNYLVINENGQADLIEVDSIDKEDDLKKYPLIGQRFSALSNSVGPDSNYSEEELNRFYWHLLDSWYNHLIDGSRKRLSDYYDTDIDTLIKNIEAEVKKYN